MKRKLSIIVFMLLAFTSLKSLAQDKSNCYYFGYAYCPKTDIIYISNLVRHSHHYNYNTVYYRQVKDQWEDYVTTYLDDKNVVNTYHSYCYIGGDNDDKCFSYDEAENLIKDLKQEYIKKGYKVREIIDFRYNPKD